MQPIYEILRDERERTLCVRLALLACVFLGDLKKIARGDVRFVRQDVFVRRSAELNWLLQGLLDVGGMTNEGWSPAPNKSFKMPDLLLIRSLLSNNVTFRESWFEGSDCLSRLLKFFAFCSGAAEVLEVQKFEGFHLACAFLDEASAVLTNEFTGEEMPM